MIKNIFLLILFSSAAFGQTSCVDADGVWRFSGSQEEVCLFGVNYNTPFAHAFRLMMHNGLNPKETIDQDVYHMARLGLDAFRIHIWDIEISDHDGNLINNKHLELFDYLVMRLKERGIKMMLTPIGLIDNGYPDKPTPTPGFSNLYPKSSGKQSTNEQAIIAQERFIRQFLQHTNRYTGVAYCDDPAVVAVELNNEPFHTGTAQQTEEYITRLYQAARASGIREPLFYNISQNPYNREIYYKTPIEGFTAAWYIAGLGGDYPVAQNLLPLTEEYPMFFEQDEGFQKRARAIYEFEPTRIDNPYIYPAMARAFRRSGFQFAAAFAYDALNIAEWNSEYPFHYLNLAYTPQKAVSVRIASEVFHRWKRGQRGAGYPEDLQEGPLRMSYEKESAEWIDNKKYLYANGSETAPPNPGMLEEIAGVGCSPIVQYEGRGAYFLDRLNDGVWRLEVMPDALRLRWPYSGNLPRESCVLITWRKHPMQINLPNLGKCFRVQQLAGAEPSALLSTNAVNQTFHVAPGTYLLKREKVNWTAPEGYKFRHMALNEFEAPPPNDRGRCYLLHTAPDLLYRQEAFQIRAEVAGAQDPSDVFVVINGIRIQMNKTGPFTYAADVPDTMMQGEQLVYSFEVEGQAAFPDLLSGTEERRVPVVGNDATVSLVNSGTRWPWLFSIRGKQNWEHWVHRRELNSGEWAFAIEAKNWVLKSTQENLEFGFIVKEKMPPAHHPDASITIRGTSLFDWNCPATVSLRMTDGSQYGAPVILTPEVQNLMIPLSDFAPVPVIRPYTEPCFFLDPPRIVKTGNPLDLSRVETLQFRFDSVPEDQVNNNGMGIVSVELHLGKTEHER